MRHVPGAVSCAPSRARHGRPAWLATFLFVATGLLPFATARAGGGPWQSVNPLETGSPVIASDRIQLAVPVIPQTPQRCGPAALQMVMTYYGSGPEARFTARSAYDPVLRGSLITDLASAARQAGFDAVVEALDPAALIALLQEGVPPIVLYQSGRAPFTVRHYGVVTGWDAAREVFAIHDGTTHVRFTPVSDLVKRWATAGSQALVVRERQP